MNKFSGTYGVVMGDLVNSRANSSPATLHSDFNAAIASANKLFKSKIISPLTITLGDEFQGLVTNLRQGLRLIEIVRWTLLDREIDCRFVLGMVELETPINRKAAWNMMGPGLSRAREILSDKDDFNLYRFSFSYRRTEEGLLNALGLALTSIEQGWTASQRAVILSSLKDDQDVGKIAHDRQVTPRSIYKIREAGNFGLYVRLRAAMASAIGEIAGACDLEPAR